MGYVKRDDAIRRWPRAAVDLRGTITGRTTWSVSVVDLSLGGCLVQCPAALDRGSIVDVSLTVAGQGLTVRGRVAHASLDGPALPVALRYLVGLEFLGLPVREERQIRQFLDDVLRRRGAVST
jgi:hypothetical protein